MELTETLKNLTQQIVADPDNGELYHLRGNTYVEIGDSDSYHKAIADFNSALKLGLDPDEVYSLIGKTYYKLGNYKSADANFKLIHNETLKLELYSSHAELVASSEKTTITEEKEPEIEDSNQNIDESDAIIEDEDLILKIEEFVDDLPVLSEDSWPTDTIEDILSIHYGENYHEKLNDLLNRLISTEHNTLQLCLGIGYDRCYTFDEVGEMLKISPDRVKQTLKSAIENLRRYANLPPCPLKVHDLQYLIDAVQSNYDILIRTPDFEEKLDNIIESLSDAEQHNLKRYLGKSGTFSTLNIRSDPDFDVIIARDIKKLMFNVKANKTSRNNLEILKTLIIARRMLEPPIWFQEPETWGETQCL